MAKYRKAPITEAIIALQTRLPGNITPETLRGLTASDPDAFEAAAEIKKAQLEFTLAETQSYTSTAQNTGWAFRSKDQRRVVQARVDGFVLSQQSPYSGWDSFKAEALTFWTAYRSIALPQAVTSINLKYVNRLDIPLPVRDLKDFFRTVVEVSPDMPQMLAGFFMQVQIPYPDINAMLVLTQTIVPPPQAGIASVVLDIDFACGNNIPPDEQGLWLLLDQMREKKNAVFEACITDAARELIL